MYLIRQTETFVEWLRNLRDTRAKARIAARLRMAGEGNLGDNKSVSNGVSEMRIDVGPGYRLYYTRRGDVVIVLLVGGDKSSQARDIERARRMAQEV
ncbi:hypothetical protein AzCIB_2674 [Azoarcus sp. CIB]|uniref:type II toxin-antitoxin system RelE/ParE family toxin n=1 Tax=Aromatoleum sp. (strain CIB) TaxID=198107 RepID=UPI00067C2766|nr:type II toxin-antitoxin system RelE/ParE family toxin [Azoarcus sp. CIB]AKU12567.1 hypothetical protein AzCIB_2674 [Azoarcus sp. CIB]